MKILIGIITILSTILIVSCSSSRKHEVSDNTGGLMTFTIDKIRNEKDGQTLFLKDSKGYISTTIISPANGNFVAVKAGDKISLIAKEIMESDPAQIISTDIKVLSSSSQKQTSMIETLISTNKSVYKLNETIELSMQATNTSKESFRFLPWGTPLENSLTGDCMKITHNGVRMPYVGIMVKRMPPTEKDYITLESEQNATGTINLSKSYTFDKKGTYTIQFDRDNHKLAPSNIISIEVK